MKKRRLQALREELLQKESNVEVSSKMIARAFSAASRNGIAPVLNGIPPGAGACTQPAALEDALCNRRHVTITRAMWAPLLFCLPHQLGIRKKQGLY